MIDGMADFTSDEKVILAEQVVDFINTSSLGIFYRYQPDLNLAEHISEAAARNGLGLFAKICLYCFIAERSTFALECRTDAALSSWKLFGWRVDLIRHGMNLPRVL